jgi:hypothetical protein
MRGGCAAGGEWGSVQGARRLVLLQTRVESAAARAHDLLDASGSAAASGGGIVELPWLVPSS